MPRQGRGPTTVEKVDAEDGVIGIEELRTHGAFEKFGFPVVENEDVPWPEIPVHEAHLMPLTEELEQANPEAELGAQLARMVGAQSSFFPTNEILESASFHEGCANLQESG